ncbi:hypothetical protein DB30_02263 [Enhygromyxa salina]|uniref:Uncharacterized protein n=1 Tax=Enhygromyxa salina TaxID=215803 RepID=A0A0C2CVQ3_9BACT|nr:hypothetical protein [Enhygromyxa salina]KIG11962.1 hypothetical protein DB30_02263 [Enhygromyxa salina]
MLESFVDQGHEPRLGSASSWGAEALGYNDFMFALGDAASAYDPISSQGIYKALPPSAA